MWPKYRSTGLTMPEAEANKDFETRSSEQKARPCPICGKPAANATRPFCSKRCADIDLHRWLGGVYAIPASEEPEVEPDAASKSNGPKPPSSEIS